jgi:hypothetical protein
MIYNEGARSTRVQAILTVYDDFFFLLLPGARAQYLIQVQVMKWEGLVAHGGHLHLIFGRTELQRRSSFDSSPSHRFVVDTFFTPLIFLKIDPFS